MGIKNLSRLLNDHAKEAIYERQLKDLFGRRIAVDASTFLYSFLVAIRPDSFQNLTDVDGNITSHLQGMFTRTVRFLDMGIKPVYVFDGKPPVLKSGELAKRSARKKEAEKDLKEAQETGDTEAAEKLVKRTVRVTKEMTDDCKTLLRLMGVPVIEAPCEAEATCAHLCKKGLVFATATEDMDALTLGTPVLYRRMTFSAQKNLPILEVHLDKALECLELTMEEFIDLCILCGCDYVDNIRGIGVVRAYKLIKQFGSIEKIIPTLNKEKNTIPDEYSMLEDIRDMFRNPDVYDATTEDMKSSELDEEGLVNFLVSKAFDENRVRKSIQKIKNARKTAPQGRLDGFFSMGAAKKSTPKSNKQEAQSSGGPSAKRPADQDKVKKDKEPKGEPEDGAKQWIPEEPKQKSQEAFTASDKDVKEPDPGKPVKPEKPAVNAFALMMKRPAPSTTSGESPNKKAKQS